MKNEIKNSIVDLYKNKLNKIKKYKKIKDKSYLTSKLESTEHDTIIRPVKTLVIKIGKFKIEKDYYNSSFIMYDDELFPISNNIFYELYNLSIEKRESLLFSKLI